LSDHFGSLVILAAFIVGSAVSAVATPIVRKYAVRWKLGDKPNGRRIHTAMIPHLGGIAIVLGTIGGVYIATLIAGDAANSLRDMLALTFPAIGLIVVLGLIDDMRSLRAVQKLTVQVLAAVLIVLSGVALYTGWTTIDIVPFSVLVITTLFIVGMSSSVNLIDGHDGLAAGVSFISALAFAVMAAIAGTPTLIVLTLAVAGSCAGFLLFNFPPGRIFMGDTGSMFLGTVLAIVACSLTMLNPTAYTFWGVCLVLGLPMLDAMLAIARRLSLKAPVFLADALHMHHVLRHAGYSPRQILGILYSMQAVFCVLGVAVSAGFVVPLFVGIAFVAVAFASFFRMMVVSRASGGHVVDISPGTIPIKGDMRSNISSQRSSVGS